MTKPFSGFRGNTIAVILLSVAVAFLLLFHFLHSDKIVYVDSAKILLQYKGAIEAKSSYDAKSKVWENNVQTLTAEFKAAMQNYEKGLAKMTDKERELSRQLIGSKQQELNNYQKAIQQNAQQENAQLLQGVVSKINEFLTRYGKEQHYRMILIANQSGTIAYGEDGSDITKEVLDKLNAEYRSNAK